ncbi:carboxymuconolactone decarboxylase family protein [Mycolicibacterium brumae]|uniref:Alkyl hydroperoxide reductase AhpD n=1 Tax=Mycolicibacterium brumae TaxID=85968 RepID=A0A2G5P4U4_9MYCO|nr:carboxymuconolactone decarboxylase family protein [Mycolicibacterium brumae]MCV7191358.1 carboxymuconolactone decarboxylase family protein [Mycolicibacterium brumae]PIB73401.1 alkyl hydroperoxide reductase [Mycolicibacterium brumae]RWA18201.1 alkyl hydroperoxide reductase [Mycolicibacterium brumae DSM 44177]UWW07387.1 carboxymuconolactone decarboxylase family protein [Mycolicibacterium brumae]
MSVDAIKEALPEFAKDLKLNLGSIVRSTELNEQQLWGALVATAAATGNSRLIKEINEDALDILSEQAYNAALGAASIMAMNNVFYRTRGQLDGKYDDQRVGLRMNIIANPGVPKEDFELWSMAVSSINGCHFCVGSHEAVVREAGLSKTAVFEAIRLASIIAGVAQALTIVDATQSVSV